jgi:glutamate decarboxylase
MAGTTVMGGFDNFIETRRICTKYGLWMHIDASWGGPAIFAPDRELMKGCGEADSITWNPHKGMGMPIQCSALLVNGHKG